MTVMTKGYWLPEIIELKLTALEAGALMALVTDKNQNTFPVSVPGPDGNPIPSTMQKVLQDKLLKAITEGIARHQSSDARVR